MNFKMNFIITVIIIGAIITTPFSWSLADDVFVDCRNQSGPWHGSLDFPYQTIQSAVDSGTTYDGDTIWVSDGIYEEGLIVEKLLEIHGAGPDVTYIDATDTGMNSAVFVEENIDLRISGFRIISPKYGINLQAYSKTIIANNIISAEYGIYCGNKPGTNVEIKNNTIVNCFMDGIHIDGYGSPGTAKIYNNIITSNNRYGIDISTTTLSVSYNCVWNNNTANYNGATAGSGSISENPRFINSSTGNLRLQLLSPCIDKGWPVKIELDPDGTQNNIGAYGGPGSTIFWPDSPGAPVVTDLSVTPAAVPSNGTITIRATGRVRPYSSGQE